MTLLSERKDETSAVNDLPARWLGASAQEVSRLEFQALDQCEGLMKVDFELASKVPEIGLAEEIVALREQLQLQAEQISSQLDATQDVEMVQARLVWEEELKARIQDERERIAETLEQFRRERAAYFAAVEEEVVKLALAIAARILHREAKLDPLLLNGVARVALEKVADDSTIVLRVPLSDLEHWQKANVTSKGACAQLAGDEGLAAGECVLDTNVGKVELGVAAQLQEIERGFFDLLQQRPA